MQRTTRNPLELVTVGTKLPQYQADLIHRAAQKARMSVNEWLPTVILPWACSDLGLDEAEALRPPAPVRPKVRDLVAEAAAREGISVREFRERAAKEAALRATRTRSGVQRTG